MNRFFLTIFFGGLLLISTGLFLAPKADAVPICYDKLFTANATGKSKDECREAQFIAKKLALESCLNQVMLTPCQPASCVPYGVPLISKFEVSDCTYTAAWYKLPINPELNDLVDYPYPEYTAHAHVECVQSCVS